MVQNGIAVSRTARWMFDRGLISISDEMKIIKPEKYAMKDVERIVNPDNPMFHPHPAFLDFHRKNVF